MDPPALTCQAVGPTRGLQAKTQKPIGNLGHALDFVSIGKLGHALDFRTIGNLGNCSAIAKISNSFERGNRRGGRWGRKALVIGNIGKIVIMFQLAKPYINRPLQYKINDKIANSRVIVL